MSGKESDDTLYRAIGAKKWEKAAELIANGEGISFVHIHQPSNCFTCLHRAIEVDAPLEVIRLLVETGAIDVNVRAIRGVTPMHVAVVRGLADIFAYLLDQGGFLDDIVEGATPLERVLLIHDHWRRRFLPFLTPEMLNQQYQFYRSFAPGKKDMTPISYVVELGHQGEINDAPRRLVELMAHGANPYAQAYEKPRVRVFNTVTQLRYKIMYSAFGERLIPMLAVCELCPLLLVLTIASTLPRSQSTSRKFPIDLIRKLPEFLLY